MSPWDAYGKILHLPHLQAPRRPPTPRPHARPGPTEPGAFDGDRAEPIVDLRTPAEPSEPGLLAASTAVSGGVEELGTQPDSTAALVATEEDEPRSAPLVTVLGKADVQWCQAPDRRVLTELALYLATHRDRARSAEELLEAIWSPSDKRGDGDVGTVQQAVSRLRRCLGGPDSIPDASAAGGYALSASIHCDLTEFRRLVSKARGAEDPRPALRDALALVTGPSFSGLRKDGYAWVWAEFLPSTVTAEVVSAAHNLAMLSLQVKDIAAADRAAQRGLLASPAEEQLHEDRLRIAHGRGERGAFERAWSDARSVLSSQAETGPVGRTYRLLRERFSDG